MTVTLLDQFGQPVVTAQKKERSSFAVFMALVTLAALSSCFWSGLNYKAWTADENPAYGPARVNDSTVKNWIPAFQDAALEWRHALPTWQIPKITLLADKDHVCSTSPEIVPIACANVDTFTIYIARDQSLYDHKTIMMHEIAHLLRVPHIEGDELMNASYQGKLDKPTPLSIAVAEYQLKHWEKK